MKKSLMLCTALLLILSLFSGCVTTGNLIPGGNTPDPSQTQTPAPSEIPSVTSVETEDTTVDIAAIETVKYTYSSDYIDVTIEIPKLTGLINSAVKDSINAIFNDVITMAQQDVTPYEAESKSLVDEGQTVATYAIYISYSVPYNQNGIISLLLSDYRYLGGAHGGDFRTAYTFDLNTGERLSLGDLMVNDSGYRDMINNVIIKEIANRVVLGELYEIATFEDVGDNPAYYLTPDAVVFYFQQYEYFPYAAGIQEFPITYSDLTGMLKNAYSALSITPFGLETSADNRLSVGDIGQIFLTGNQTTGYSWHYVIGDGSILELSRSQYQTDAKPGIVGAGGTYTWDLRALKAGTTEITFKYYRDWLGESDAAPEDNVVYTVIVK